MTCESQIEKSYYSIDGRSLRLKNICIYCGEMGGEGFLLDSNQLWDRCLTGGYKCFPICVECLGSGKKVVTKGSKNAKVARDEKAMKEKMKKAKKNA